MEFTLILDKSIMISYAKHLGYDEEELTHLGEDEAFKETLIDILEKSCESAIL